MNVEDEASYACPACGEEILVPVDASAGDLQEYVEDCPVCCSPVLLTVQLDDAGEITIVARPE